MRSAFDHLPRVLLAAALGLSGGEAKAESASDPSYGRIDGDVTVAVGAGAVAAARGPRAEAELRVRYLETAGLFATYEDASVLGSASEPPRILSTGLELRPLFLFRWLEGYEAQHARLDLAIDSLGLELGATFEQPSGSAFGSRRGIEVGLGLELPILESATGPWIGIHGALRWSDNALGSGVVDNADDRQAVLAITLAWHQLLATHIVEAGDEAPR
jgi:hypothetical protein